MTTLNSFQHHSSASCFPDMVKPEEYKLKHSYVQWFQELQDHICARLESIEQEYCQENPKEKAGKFRQKDWQRIDITQPNQDGGGGWMRILEDGAVFEKAGVNVSTVFGNLPQTFATEIPGGDKNKQFWASGISLVIHPRNPYVPIVHMNTRHIITTKEWFGGGADLTPCIPFDEDTNDFHNAMKEASDLYAANAYEQYKKWCDDYFYLSHRGEPRGVGGIFFDDLNSGDPILDFDYLKNVGQKFMDVYEKIVRRRMHMHYGDEEKRIQLKKRGRYVEFNLLYDRGTRFGLMTNGNAEAILMSLPPMAAWNVSI